MNTPTSKRTFSETLSIDENQSSQRKSKRRLETNYEPPVDINMHLTITDMTVHLFKNKSVVIYYLQQIGLMANTRLCPEHNSPMELREDIKKN